MLDPNVYYVIAGKPVLAQIRMLQYMLCDCVEEDTELHEIIHDMGYRGVEIVYRRMVASEDWLLRHDSVHDAYIPLLVTESYEDAQAAARQWVAQDPPHRYAFTRASTLGDALGALIDPALE